MDKNVTIIIVVLAVIISLVFIFVLKAKADKEKAKYDLVSQALATKAATYKAPGSGFLNVTKAIGDTAGQLGGVIGMFKK